MGNTVPFNQMTNDDVTVMISWWNISGISRMSKISNMLNIVMTLQVGEKDKIWESTIA